jgi:hypothetical protein
MTRWIDVIQVWCQRGAAMFFRRKNSSINRVRCLCGTLVDVTPRDLDRGVTCRKCRFPLPVRAIRMALEAPPLDTRRPAEPANSRP